jgi:uncharacterized protein YbjT (DUF2867 family)
MKIVVLGATGRTGRLVVEQALMRGDEVVAYVRNPHGIATNPGFEISVGQFCGWCWSQPTASATRFARQG